MMTEHHRFVLFDLDHTTSDASRRDHMIEEARRTNIWEPYHEDSINDDPCHDVVELLNAFRHCGYPCLAITARPKKFARITAEWLVAKKIWFDDVMMNPRYDWEPSAPLKIGMCRARWGAHFAKKILMIIDDHPEVIKAFQMEGVTGMMVHGRRY